MHSVVAALTSIGVLTATNVTCSPRAPQATEEVQKDIIRVEREWREARIKGNIAFLEALYAPDLRITGTDGSVNGRDADIALFASGALKPQSLENEDTKVFVYGDAAVAIGLDRFKGSYRGHYGEGAYRFTHVYVRRHGRWQLVASQGTTPRAR